MVCTGLKNWSIAVAGWRTELMEKSGPVWTQTPLLRAHVTWDQETEPIVLMLTQRMCIVCVTQTSWKKAHKETQIFKLWLSWLCVVYERIGCRLFLNLDLTSIIPRHIFKCFSASISQPTNLLCRLQTMTKALELYWFPWNNLHMATPLTLISEKTPVQIRGGSDPLHTGTANFSSLVLLLRIYLPPGFPCPICLYLFSAH